MNLSVSSSLCRSLSSLPPKENVRLNKSTLGREFHGSWLTNMCELWKAPSIFPYGSFISAFFHWFFSVARIEKTRIWHQSTSWYVFLLRLLIFCHNTFSSFSTFINTLLLFWFPHIYTTNIPPVHFFPSIVFLYNTHCSLNEVAREPHSVVKC